MKPSTLGTCVSFGVLSAYLSAGCGPSEAMLRQKILSDQRKFDSRQEERHLDFVTQQGKAVLGVSHEAVYQLGFALVYAPMGLASRNGDNRVVVEPGTPPQGLESLAAEEIKKMDRNGNSVIDKGEYKAALEKLPKK